MDSFNDEFLRLASNVKPAPGEASADLLGACIKKFNRASSKQQLAIDYEKPGNYDQVIEGLNERIYHYFTRDIARSGPTPPAADPDATHWQMNLTRLVNQLMEANFTKMGFNKKFEKKKPGNSTASSSLSSTMQQAYEATRECWSCKKSGHIRKNCPQKASNGGPGLDPKSMLPRSRRQAQRPLLRWKRRERRRQMAAVSSSCAYSRFADCYYYITGECERGGARTFLY
ncbi:hypothetical protein FN846DRAFT_894026 [Sphaerosporella brunnea]|uniref:CCHC-type domain-containing protein n=1 Tax=Sphaerosporella brunnea TaxID=1250544 RepID=A0A5J5EJH6_9PEZI|nr:hypothetical protein FN846DRAFT_894026 [Sphaerosporella brunnea]